MSTGRKSRADRLTSHHRGAWATTSQDYAALAADLFALSTADAARNAKLMSMYVFAGLPLLFSALRALIIECNSGVYGVERDAEVLNRLAREQNELNLLREHYLLAAALTADLELLYEVRNEIVHPSHRPSGAPDSTPEYLRPLKVKGVLVTSGDPKSDYTWMHQLQSHKLFQFAFSKVEETVVAVLAFHRARDPHFECLNQQTYARHRQA